MNQISSDRPTGDALAHVDLPIKIPLLGCDRCIALDVRVTSGSVSIGTKIMLRGPRYAHSLRIVGIEAFHDSNNKGVVRIHCAANSAAPIPPGVLEGWTFIGE
jgi:hypothetical protein